MSKYFRIKYFPLSCELFEVALIKSLQKLLAVMQPSYEASLLSTGVVALLLALHDNAVLCNFYLAVVNFTGSCCSTASIRALGLCTVLSYLITSNKQCATLMST